MATTIMIFSVSRLSATWEVVLSGAQPRKESNNAYMLFFICKATCMTVSLTQKKSCSAAIKSVLLKSFQGFESRIKNNKNRVDGICTLQISNCLKLLSCQLHEQIHCLTNNTFFNQHSKLE